jgi:hypothetical protein
MPEHRLPEAITGHPRSTYEVPVPYPQACNPQAWSASATIQMLQVLLGLYPFAPLGVMAVVRARLPEWAAELTLRRVRVGRAAVDLRFTRNSDGSASHAVVGRRGAVLVLPAGPPNAAGGLSVLEAVESAALKAMPSARLRAARIALGWE